MHENPWEDLYSREISIRKVNCQQIKYDINEKPLKTHKNRYITRKTDNIDPLVGSSATPRNQLGGQYSPFSSLYNGFCSFLRFFINIIFYLLTGNFTNTNFPYI